MAKKVDEAVLSGFTVSQWIYALIFGATVFIFALLTERRAARKECRYPYFIFCSSIDPV